MTDLTLILPSLIGLSTANIENLFEGSCSRNPVGRRLARARKNPPQFRAADLTRAIKAVRKAGQIVAGSEITRDGTIRILHSASAEHEPTPFDRWKAGRDACEA